MAIASHEMQSTCVEGRPRYSLQGLNVFSAVFYPSPPAAVQLEHQQQHYEQRISMKTKGKKVYTFQRMYWEPPGAATCISHQHNICDSRDSLDALGCCLRRLPVAQKKA